MSVWAYRPVHCRIMTIIHNNTIATCQAFEIPSLSGHARANTDIQRSNTVHARGRIATFARGPGFTKRPRVNILTGFHLAIEVRLFRINEQKFQFRAYAFASRLELLQRGVSHEQPLCL